jgi:hypothetical protein
MKTNVDETKIHRDGNDRSHKDMAKVNVVQSFGNPVYSNSRERPYIGTSTFQLQGTSNEILNKDIKTKVKKEDLKEDPVAEVKNRNVGIENRKPRMGIVKTRAEKKQDAVKKAKVEETIETKVEDNNENTFEEASDKDDKNTEHDDCKEIVYSELPQFHASYYIVSKEERKSDDLRSFEKFKTGNEDSENPARVAAADARVAAADARVAAADARVAAADARVAAPNARVAAADARVAAADARTAAVDTVTIATTGIVAMIDREEINAIPEEQDATPEKDNAKNSKEDTADRTPWSRPLGSPWQQHHGTLAARSCRDIAAKNQIWDPGGK